MLKYSVFESENHVLSIIVPANNANIIIHM